MKVQVFVAGLISSNFFCNVIEKWIDPDGSKVPAVWYASDLFFNIAFLIELLLNMYGFWWRRFWKSAWNVFDFVVVTIGMLDVLQVPLPGPLSLLRMMRAFRVFRLFKRVKSLNKIMVALAKAVPGVVNAFVILFLVMCIYAILGVEFFSEFANDGTFTTDDGEEVTGYWTGRNLGFGDEYFGNFGKALYTCFQVLTCESWSEAIARPLINTDNNAQAILATVYFVSFNLVMGVVLINVVIAVLLEKMVDDESKDGGHPEEHVPETSEEPSEPPEEETKVPEGEPKQEAKAVDAASQQHGNGHNGASQQHGNGHNSLKDREAPAENMNSAVLDAMEADFSRIRRDMCTIREQMQLLSTALKRPDERSLH